MTAMAARALKPLYGQPKPRIAPPTPARSDVKAFRETAAAMGIELMPWQETAARYLTATGKDGRHLYREVAIVVARQNGKTTLMKPYIIAALRAGKKIMHIAQNRELPRQMFGTIADALSGEPDLFPKRRGRVIWPRYGSGQEEIALVNGGSYRIAAASRGGGRGWPNDIVIIDELREMKDHDVMGAVEPTLTMSPDPQEIYLSNAGAEDSVVLNAIRDRAGKDDSLAYLEWSAAPERAAADIAGWTEANPAMGHYPSVLETLEKKYRSCQLSGTLSIFETEHLCRWVVTTGPLAVDPESWLRGRAPLKAPVHPMLGLSMDPSGTRASAVMAWKLPADQVAVRLVADVTGSPIDTAIFGRNLSALATKYGTKDVAFSAWTDADLARQMKNSKPMSERDFANASENFHRLVESGRVTWDVGEEIGDDLAYVTRRQTSAGAWMAAKAREDHPVTAAFAAIRAVWLASEPAAAQSGAFMA